jgi:NAD+ diphosphatase
VRFEYCPVCGNKTVPRDLGDEKGIPYCETCERPWFPFTYSCILALVVDDNDNFAMIRQNYVNPDYYIAVAGYPDAGEPYEETVRREVFEEIGLTVVDMRYVRSYYHEKRKLMMLGFVARVERGEFRLSGEVDEAKWFTKDEVEAMLAQRENKMLYNLFTDYYKMYGR